MLGEVPGDPNVNISHISQMYAFAEAKEEAFNELMSRIGAFNLFLDDAIKLSPDIVKDLVIHASDVLYKDLITAHTDQYYITCIPLVYALAKFELNRSGEPAREAFTKASSLLDDFQKSLTSAQQNVVRNIQTHLAFFLLNYELFDDLFLLIEGIIDPKDKIYEYTQVFDRFMLGKRPGKEEAVGKVLDGLKKVRDSTGEREKLIIRILRDAAQGGSRDIALKAYGLLDAMGPSGHKDRLIEMARQALIERFGDNILA